MPAHERSLQITDAYRRTLIWLAGRAEVITAADWQRLVDIDNLDGTHPAFRAQAAATLATLQATSVRLSGAYLGAFLRSELNDRSIAAPTIDPRRYVGRSRTGKTLEDQLTSTVITVKNAIAAGTAPGDAARHGARQAVRLASTEVVHAARAATSDGIRADERLIGWRRVTSGGCGACLAATTGAIHADRTALPVHDHCRCTTEPVVRDVPDTVTRPTGADMVAGMTTAQQDAALGTETAALLRAGQITLPDLIATSPMVAIADQITQAPIKALT
jgi:hypothetical protein